MPSSPRLTQVCETVSLDGRGGDGRAARRDVRGHGVGVSPRRGASIWFSDSDDVVAPGTTIDVAVDVNDPDENVTSAATVAWIEAENGVFFVDDTQDTRQRVAAASGTAARGNDQTFEPAGTFRLRIPQGTAAREYVISAEVDLDGSGDGKAITIKKPLTVGDAGTAVASAVLSLSTVGKDANSDGDFEDADDGDIAPHTPGRPVDTATAKQGDPIYLAVSVKNSRGETTDNSAVTSVSIIAATGHLGRGSETPSSDNSDSLNYNTNSEDGNAAATDATATTTFAVTKPTAGKLEVYAVIVGTTGAATSNTLELTFTGNAKAITLHNPNSPLGPGGSAYVEVTAEDGSGNVASLRPNQVSANVLNDPSARFTETPYQAPRANMKFRTEAPATPVDPNDETAADTIAFNMHDEGDCDGTTTDSECDPNKVRIVIAAGAGTAAGEHTLQVKLGNDDTEEITIVVAGAPGSLVLESTHDTVSIGDIITITATVTDADGHPVVNAAVADGVSFEAVGSLMLSALRDNDPNKDNDTMVALKDGVATARFLVSQGSGTSSIVAEYTAGTASVDAVISVSTEAAEAMPEEEASVACLSNLNGFSTWSCGVESSASEIFDLVSGRGATALHLWNGTAWVRYSVVDGTMVPGSSDFMVAENDILYISN